MGAAISIAIIVFAMASTGAIFQPGQWYERLDKPSWTPPDWAFPVVWTILYVAIGTAGWLVWRKAGGTDHPAVVFWLVQIVANGLWSYLFFGRRRPDIAFWDVGILWLSIAAFAVTAWPLSPVASLLFLPYLCWVTVAAALNLSVWRRNPDAIGVS